MTVQSKPKFTFNTDPAFVILVLNNILDLPPAPLTDTNRNLS